MTPKRWMIVTWGVILTVIIGMSVAYGGRNCEVPNSGPFHALLAGHRFVTTHAGRYACKEVK